MADSYLLMPETWYKGTLEPEENSEYIISVDSGGTPSTIDDTNWDGNIPWLTPKEITRLGDTIYVSSTERNITDKGLKNSGAKLMPAETVMLTKRAPVGVVVVNAIPMATNQGFLNFRCGPKLRPLYLAHWLRANKRYLNMVSNGSTYPELYKGDLFEFQIAIPELHEQDLIISIINSVHHLKLLGSMIEQSFVTVEELQKVQNKIKHLDKLEETLVFLLLSGQVKLENFQKGVKETYGIV
jgi:restriction endonuclease S subunit